MKVNRMFLFVVLMATSMFLQSCSETMDSEAAQIRLNMRAETSQSTMNSRTVNAGFVFNEVLLGVTELEFETLEQDEQEDATEDDSENDVEDDDEAENEEEEGEIEYEGAFIVDLIKGSSSPDFGIADITPGTYKEIEIEMEPILENGFTIFVAFDYTNANDEVVKVEYGNSDELEFEVENENGFVLEAGAMNQILVLLDLDVFFEGIDLSNAVADEDGVIRINETSNAAIAEAIASNLDQILEAGEDDDEDGDIDED